MTLGPIDAARLPDAPDRTSASRTTDAAKQFEQVLMQQLWQTMRSTVGGALGGESAGSATYMHFLDEAVAQSLSDAGGIGLAAQVAEALGAPTRLAAYRASSVLERQAPVELGPAIGQRVDGATGRLQGAATEMLAGASPARFAREGRLTTTELASDFHTNLSDGSVAAFNVRDAAGFEGEFKCNLFAFELVRRAGFQVPLVGRTRGWGYPDPDAVTLDAADGRVRRDWGRVVTGEQAAVLDAAARSGERAYLLTGSGTDGHAGHMAVVERVHEVRYDDDGRVLGIVFDGWEARETGARHLERRTWNRLGNRGGHDARNGFESIEIIELLAPRVGAPETPLGGRVGPSRHDAPNSSSSSERERPMARVEERI